VLTSGYPIDSITHMPRTMIDLDPAVLRELKRRQRLSGHTIGQIASELLSRALRDDRDAAPDTSAMRWRSAPMGALVDLEDKKALRHGLDALRS
jgi:hypothetical protein